MCKINLDCSCCDRPEPEPCSTYECGWNGRCVYCDHEAKCHKKWGDVFRAARQRGEGIDTAANTAELWMMTHKPSKSGRGGCEMPYRKPKSIDLTGWLAPWEADVLRKQIARYEQLRAALEAMDTKLEVESSFEERGETYVAFYRVPAGPWHKILGLIRG